MSFLGLRPASTSLLGAVRTACSTTWPGMRTTPLASTVAPAPAKISRASSSSTNTPVRSRTSSVPRWMSARSSSVSTRNSHAVAACAPRLGIPSHGRTSLLVRDRRSGLQLVMVVDARRPRRAPAAGRRSAAGRAPRARRARPAPRRRRRRPRCGPRRATARTAAASRSRGTKCSPARTRRARLLLAQEVAADADARDGVGQQGLRRDLDAARHAPWPWPAISASTGIMRRLNVLDESRKPKPPLQMSAPVATAAITLSPFS